MTHRGAARHPTATTGIPQAANRLVGTPRVEGCPATMSQVR
ncbi:MAG: hypothetical protein ACRYF3_03920 [Janthinobacterium lividum]